MKLNYGLFHNVYNQKSSVQITQPHQKKNPVHRTRHIYLYVFGVAESESGVGFTSSGQSQGYLKVKSRENG